MNFNTNQIIEVRQTVRAAPVGSCIYCGATDQLSDEHVVPYALGGRFVLPESSCPRCSTITSGFERRVLRGFMLDARTAGNYPTRRPKDRPKSLFLKVGNNEQLQQIGLLPSEHPGILQLPLLEPPGILTGRPETTGVSICGSEMIYFGKNPFEAARDLGVKTLEGSVDWDVTSFARMVAKIGYSFAVANAGPLTRSNVPILPLILGTVDNASFWLGSAQFKLRVEEQAPTHALGYTLIPDPHDKTKRLLVVLVKLFVPSGATGYLVVVNRN